MHNNQHTAAILVIGNEILSGRTQDKNTQFIANELTKIGVILREVIVIPDEEGIIIKHLNNLRKKYSYVFATGGIGSTHDDITSRSVAKAFGVKLVRNEKAVSLIKARYKEKNASLNEEAFKMADIPKTATLVKNGISGAPGFAIENVFILAGVPSIMQSMFQYVKENLLEHGKEIFSHTLTVLVGESNIATNLAKLQESFKTLQIGTYPFIKDDRWCTHVVIRGQELTKINKAAQKLKDYMKKNNIEFHEEAE
jgi:molybdenum cofactor synthesis domain-containing protein